MLTRKEKGEVPTAVTETASQTQGSDVTAGEAVLSQPPVEMTFHHVGVAVKSIARSLDTYVGLFGFRQVTESLEVPTENVRVCFVEAPDGVLIELVEGITEDSPVAHIVKQPGAGPYHLCYSVSDLNEAVEKLRQRKCFLLKKFERPAHGHRRFAFLLSPERQLFELCEPEDSEAE